MTSAPLSVASLNVKSEPVDVVSSIQKTQIDSRIAELEKSLRAEKERNESLQKKLAELEIQNEGLNKKVITLQGFAADWKAAFDRKNDQLKDAFDKIDHLQGVIIGYREQLVEDNLY